MRIPLHTFKLKKSFYTFEILDSLKTFCGKGGPSGNFTIRFYTTKINQIIAMP